MTSKSFNASLAGDIGRDLLNSPEMKGAISSILAGLLSQLVASIFAQFNKPGSKPSDPADPPIQPIPDEIDDTDNVEAPKPGIRRVPAELRANYSGITRKKFPYQEQGGRLRLGAQKFREVISRATGLQAGDVVDINITPYDQFGKPFLPGEGVNELLLRPDGFPGFRHNISGKAYLVREAPKPSDPYGCTPGLRIPSTFQDDEVKPGYRGEVTDTIELHLDADGKAVPEDQTGVTVLKVTLPTLRVTPWASDQTKPSEVA